MVSNTKIENKDQPQIYKRYYYDSENIQLDL